MIFKAGLFVFLCGIVFPFYDGAYLIWWSAKHKKALKEYWINKKEGKSLTEWMISSRNDYYVMWLSGLLIALGLLLILVGFIWEV